MFIRRTRLCHVSREAVWARWHRGMVYEERFAMILQKIYITNITLRSKDMLPNFSGRSDIL